MLRLNHIFKIYNGSAVVDDVSLTVDTATTMALIGPSGCGKSTVLRIIAGLISADRGEVYFGEQQLAESSRSAIRERLGYVIQDGGLFPHLTAAENVRLASRFRRWPPDRIQNRLEELARLTRFPIDGLQRYPTQLSGGQRQRVGIMRALMTDPDVLLLDEPLAALDPMIRRELQDDLQQIFQSLRKTVLLVTHDLHEAAWFARRIVLMQSGRIEQQGTAGELLNSPASPFVTKFIQAQRTSAFGATA